MGNKKIILIVASALMAVMLTACSAGGGSVDDGTYTWNVALNLSESTLNYQFYAQLKKEMEERSDGTVKINLYPNGQLGGDAEQLLGLIDGTIDFSTTITSSLTSTIPQYSLFDLPNAFTDIESMRAVEDNQELIKALNEASAEKGIHLMGIADAGFRELSTNVEAHSIEQLKGTKIRVMDNPYHQEYWNSLGCATTTMDFNEVYSSLQQKVIDAEENPYMNICANNFYEVQDYIIETNHLGHIMVFTMNKELYDSLPDDVRDLLDDCVADALEATRVAADEAIDGYKKTIEESGSTIIELEPETLQKMQEMAEPVYDMVRRDLGDELVDIFVEACQSAD